MSDGDGADELIDRLKERAADPARRVDERPSEFWASVTSAGPGVLMGMAGSMSADLARLLAHGPSADIVATADRIRGSMEKPADRPLPPPATVEGLDAAERAMGVRLPPLLRRLYLEVADGGFGPGPGLVGIRGGATTDQGKTIEDLYDEMLDATTEDPAWIWPANLVPVADLHGVFACIDCATPAGRVIEFDFEELDGDGPHRGWSRAFTDRAGSLAEWLEAWLDTPAPPSQADMMSAGLSAAMMDIPEVTRQYWASMSPAERAEYGLPPTGWGRVLFGDAWGNDPRDGSTA